VKTSFSFLLCVFLFSAAHAQIAGSNMHTEASFKEYFSKNATSLNDIEGIWQVSSGQYYYKEDTLYDAVESKNAARVAIVENDGKFQSYILSGEPYNVEFIKTDVPGVYFYRNYFKETNEYSKTEAVISKRGEMQYEYEIPEMLLQLRLADLYVPGIKVRNEVKWTKVFPGSNPKKK
jgi:hypothetical protein